MEVHAHSHTPRKKWTHYFWEFFMLFLAMTLCFVVENKMKHRIEHRRTKKYVLMFKGNLINDTFQLGSLIRNTQGLQESFGKILAVFKKDRDSITLGDLNFQKKSSVDLSVFVCNNATYSQLKSSGNLRYFSNTILIGKSGNYEAQIKRFESVWNTAQNIYGGISSEHFLQHKINTDKLLKNNSGKNPLLPVKTLGYSFQSWDESGIITENLLEYLSGFSQVTYPELKKTAAEIIELLNEEYHLK